MKGSLKKPYFYFWVASFIILVTGYVSYIQLGSSALDINVHDTYFVIAHNHYIYALSGSIFFIGFIYWILEKLEMKQISILTRIHVTVTIGSIVLLSITNSMALTPYNLVNNHVLYNTITTALFLLALLAQIIFLINIIQSIFKNGLQRTTSN